MGTLRTADEIELATLSWVHWCTPRPDLEKSGCTSPQDFSARQGAGRPQYPTNTSVNTLRSSTPERDSRLRTWSTIPAGPARCHTAVGKSSAA